MDDTSSAPRPPNARELVIVVARARNGVIGRDNALPWRLPEDLSRFRALTTGHAILMGRKTWESIGRPLPGRENIVVSHSLAATPAGCVLVRSLAEGVSRASLPDPVFCIGGAELYRAALPRSERIELTEVDVAPEGDAFFPPLDPAEWRERSRERRRDPASGVAFSFVTLVRTRASGAARRPEEGVVRAAPDGTVSAARGAPDAPGGAR